MSEPTGVGEPVVTAFLAPKCLGCGYTLAGLPEPRCPECGRPFDPFDPRTYGTKPPFVRWRYWLPGLATSLGGGLLLYAFMVTASGFSWATTIVLPLCAGVLLGYGVRVRWFVIVLLALLVASGFVFGLITMSFAGLYCGLILGGIALGPLLLGTFIGWVLRVILKRSRWDQRWHLPTLVALALPLVCAGIDRGTWSPPPAEAVRTVAVLPVGEETAWRNLRFYEQVKAPPEPAIFRWHWLGLPRPLQVSGSIRKVGDRTVCVYDKGRLVKETTAVEDAGPTRRLAFRVVEQEFERHAMRLVGGSFTFEPVDATHTRVTLETTYVPHLGPRWCWRASERWTVHQLHSHVLDGIAIDEPPPAQVAQGEPPAERP